MKMELCRGCTLLLLLSSIVKVKLLVLPNILPGQRRSTLPNGIPIDIKIQSDSEIQAVVYRNAGSDNFQSHILILIKR